MRASALASELPRIEVLLLQAKEEEEAVRTVVDAGR